MATTEPLTGATVYQQTDAALGGQQLGDVVGDLAPFVTPRFTSTSTRDTAYAAYVAAGGVIVNGMTCWCDAPGSFFDRVGGAWLQRDAAWTSFSPTWNAVGGTPSIGNGTLVGRFLRTGRICLFRIELRTGSTTNGTTGAYTFTGLPFTATGTVEQAVLCKAYTNGNANWVGFALITGTTAVPYLPLGSSNTTLDQVRNADATAAVGTGIPQVGGQFTFGGSTTRNLVISGSYEI